MKIENLHLLVYTDKENKLQTFLCYTDLDMDINSEEFRDEFCIPQDTNISQIPPEKWNCETICNAMDYFFDDRCKRGAYYDPHNFLDILNEKQLNGEVKKSIMMGILKLVEQQFGDKE